MARFTVRVELNGTGPIDYTDFHPAMEIKGFTRTIKAQDVVIHELPNTEYSLIGPYTIKQDAKKARIAVQELGGGFSVLVSEVMGVHHFYNLKRL